jgi:hypothetical protein
MTDYGCYQVVCIDPKVLEAEFPVEYGALVALAPDGDLDELLHILAEQERDSVLAPADFRDDVTDEELEAIADAFQVLVEAFSSAYPGLILGVQDMDENMSTSPDALEGGVFAVYGAYGWTPAAAPLKGKLTLKDVIWYG